MMPRKWATAFLQHFPDSKVDEEILFGWFANAIERSWGLPNWGCAQWRACAIFARPRGKCASLNPQAPDPALQGLFIDEAGAAAARALQNRDLRINPPDPEIELALAFPTQSARLTRIAWLQKNGFRIPDIYLEWLAEKSLKGPLAPQVRTPCASKTTKMTCANRCQGSR